MPRAQSALRKLRETTLPHPELRPRRACTRGHCHPGRGEADARGRLGRPQRDEPAGAGGEAVARGPKHTRPTKFAVRFAGASLSSDDSRETFMADAILRSSLTLLLVAS